MLAQSLQRSGMPKPMDTLPLRRIPMYLPAEGLQPQRMRTRPPSGQTRPARKRNLPLACPVQVLKQPPRQRLPLLLPPMPG